MFLRKCKRAKNGKRHTYWALVESYRTARGSRQRVVAYLGQLKGKQKSGWEQLGRKLDKKSRPQLSLFDPPSYEEPADEEFVEINLKGVRFERLRDFGDVWLGLGLWRLLGLDKLLSEIMSNGREEVPWHVVAAILTLGRFCEPSSELHIEDTWYERTALEDLLGVSADKVHTDRLYAGLDCLLAHKEVIEKHLKERLGDLFDLKFDLLLYDVTSTYFEGQCKSNSMAKYGYSRDSRPDCLQVCIGLVVTEDGMPLGYEVFDGNTHDSKTVEGIVKVMENKYGRANRVWVMDRGMVSENNLRFIRGRDGSYIVGTPKGMLHQFEQYLLDKDWHEVQEGVEVKLVANPDNKEELFVLARSIDRGKKEHAMHRRFIERMQMDLEKLQNSARSGRLKDIDKAYQRLGRIKQRYWRASGAFNIKIVNIGNPADKAKLKVTFERNKKCNEWNELSEGCYLLRTNLTNIDPQTLWKQYIQLTEAEWAFRITKDELVIRPIWHHKAERVRAHILVCFLAYVLWKTLAQWMKRSGLGEAPRRLLEEFSRIKSGDVVLSTRAKADQPKKTIRLRCVTLPDEAQKILLSRLGLTLPQRLRRIDEIAQM
jgi:transposase